jgi:septal ring factor EnvC (AmiA/AmiB activator)
VKALERRTAELKESVIELNKEKEKISVLEKRLSQQDEKLTAQQRMLDEWRKELVLIKNTVNIQTECNSNRTTELVFVNKSK